MPSPSLPPLRAVGDRAAVPLPAAAVGWLGAWFAGNIVPASTMQAAGHDSVAEAGPAWLAVTAVLTWGPMLGVMWALGRRHGTGRPVADYGFSFRPVDLVGIPIGVLTQLVLVRLLYWPLESIWPDTFRMAKVEERTQELWDASSGAGLALLVVVVILGAPLVEELVYRGLLQGALTRRLSDVLGLAVAALWFALIHFQPIEYPGLFLAGLAFGVCMVRTDRLGMSIVAHAAFNATALVLAAGR